MIEKAMQNGFIVIVLIYCSASCVGKIGDDYVADCEDARVAAIYAWIEVVGPVSDECYQKTVDTIVEEVDEIPGNCRRDIPNSRIVVGCRYPSKIVILATRTAEQKARTCVHEWLHEIDACEFDSIDYKHANMLLWEEFGENTAEAVGESNLGF